MASIELDPSIKQALKHLHSNSRDSTEQVRLLLDDVLRHTYGASKTMANVLSKKYLAEERNDNYQKLKSKGESSKSNSSKNVSVAQPSQSPQQIQIPERADDDDSSVMERELELLEEDLTCAVCRQIAVQAGNRLVECDVCHALYHQDCHKPVISESDVGSGWQCAACLISTHGFAVSNAAPVKSGTLSGSSTPIKCSSSKGVQPSSSVKAPSTISSSSSKVVTPNINIISADKRLQIMKKKAAKQQENKRKHSK